MLSDRVAACLKVAVLESEGTDEGESCGQHSRRAVRMQSDDPFSGCQDDDPFSFILPSAAYTSVDEATGGPLQTGLNSLLSPIMF